MTLFRLLFFIARHPLNRGHASAALLRFLRWQIACRLLDTKIQLPFVGDTTLLASRGMCAATGNWYWGLMEPNEMGFLLHVLRPESLFLDVGANIGSFTVLAAGAVGATVLAVEPIPKTFAHLKANVLVNDLSGRVDLRCMGLSDSAGLLRFITTCDTINRVALPDDSLESVAVPVSTIDAISINKVPEIIKIDVEGYETAVLRGAKQTLASDGLLAVIVETNGSGKRYGYQDSLVYSIMDGFGFQPTSYNAQRRRLGGWSEKDNNTIFVRNKELVEARIGEAPRYRLVTGEI